MKKVTIIITVFNQELYIGRCIRSVLAQNFPRNQFDIIVVNDSSEDKSLYALNLFHDEITIISNEKNLGLPASLNIAIRKVKTPYFTRVDGDDFVSENFLLMLYNFISSNDSMDAVACDYNLVTDLGDFIERKNCMVDPIGCGIIFRTDQIVDLGLYDESFLMHEERDLRIRFLKKYKINRLELPLYRYRIHNNNITNNKEKFDQYLNKLSKKHI